MIVLSDIEQFIAESQGAEALGIELPLWIRRAQRSVFSNVRTRTNYYRFLHRLVIERQPSVAVELGVEFGIGSAMMAVANWGTHVVGIDVNNHEIPTTIIPRNCPNYTFLCGDSTVERILECMRVIVNKYGPIGVVFQDSSHHYTASVREWDAYSQFLDVDAVWVCDDITPAFHDPKIDPHGMGMVQYFQELPGTKDVYPDVLHMGNTVGVALL